MAGGPQFPDGAICTKQRRKEVESEELVWSKVRTQFQSGADLNGREPERKRGRQGEKEVDIGAPVKNRGEGPKGKTERRQHPEITEASEETRMTSGVALRMQRQWWGGRPPRLMFEPRWNK